MLAETGIPTQADLSLKIPTKERLLKGPVAIIECFSSIPCDPCYYSCPVKAISRLNDLNEVPSLDFDRCTGCGLCMVHCPGLAIFVVDYQAGLVKIPYEFIPLPDVGSEVVTLNRAGEEIGIGRVEKVQAPEKFNKTAIVWLSVPEEQIMKVRHFKVGDNNG